MTLRCRPRPAGAPLQVPRRELALPEQPPLRWRPRGTRALFRPRFRLSTRPRRSHSAGLRPSVRRPRTRDRLARLCTRRRTYSRRCLGRQDGRSLKRWALALRIFLSRLLRGSRQKRRRSKRLLEQCLRRQRQWRTGTGGTAHGLTAALARRQPPPYALARTQAEARQAGQHGTRCFCPERA